MFSSRQFRVSLFFTAIILSPYSTYSSRQVFLALSSELQGLIGPDYLRRSVEGRLTAIPLYSSLQVRTTKTWRSKHDLEKAMRKWELHNRASTALETLCKRATLRLVAGDVDLAAKTLEKARLSNPNNIRVLTDLSAIYLEVARRGTPQALLLALVMADRASSLDPESEEARFNRALALEKLALQLQAQNAWRSYLSLDGDSGWSVEARHHIREIPPILSTKNQLQIVRNRAASTSPSFERTVLRYKRASLLYAEDELFGTWAKCYLAAGEPDRCDLTTANKIGVVFLHALGDHLIVDVVREVSDASPANRRLLAQGYQAFSEGRVFYEDGGFVLARKRFKEAHRCLAAGSSHFASRALYYLAVSEHHSSHFKKALAALTALKSKVSREKYPILCGQIDVALGLTYAILGAHSSSLQHYGEAGAASGFIRIPEYSASLSNLMSDEFENLGDMARAWLYRYRALISAKQIREPMTLRAIYFVAGYSELENNNALTAAYFQNEALYAALASKHPQAIAEAFLWRSRIGRSLGLLDLPARDLVQARNFASQILDAEARSQSFANISLAEGHALLETDPGESLVRLREATAYYEKSKNHAHLEDCYHFLAQAYIRFKKLDPAERYFNLAAREYEEGRREIASEELRISFFGRSTDLFDEWLEFLAARRTPPEELLNVAERGRARVLSDHLRRPNKGDSRKLRIVGEPLDTEALQVMIPKDTAVIEYSVLRDTLLCWIVTRERIRVVKVRISSSKLEQMIGGFIASDEVYNHAAFRDSSSALYNVLIDPVRPHIDTAARLVLVTEKCLSGVPFAALLNPRSNRYLIEEYMLSFCPSASVFALAKKRALAIKPESEKILVVADSRFNRSMFRTLSPLPGSKPEAMMIKSMHLSVDTLTGAEATKERLFSLIPGHTVLHFAVHSVVSRSRPGTSMLLLTPDIRSRDGVLYGYEIASKDFDSTTFVFLAGCEAAEGVFSRGEGIRSLARDFLSAGVPLVIANSFASEDREVGMFVANFYKELEGTRDPVASLREAQLSAIRSEVNPLSWAGFQAIGASIERSR